MFPFFFGNRFILQEDSLGFQSDHLVQIPSGLLAADSSAQELSARGRSVGVHHRGGRGGRRGQS